MTGRSLRLFALCTMICNCAQSRSEQFRSSVQAAVQNFVDAINRGDSVSVAALYMHDQRVSTASDGALAAGWDSVRVDLDEVASGREGRLHVVLGSVQAVPLGSQHALAVTPFALTVETRTGESKFRGAMTLVLERAGSEWLILHDHESFVPEHRL